MEENVQSRKVCRFRIAEVLRPGARRVLGLWMFANHSVAGGTSASS
jgi:hypothetical protein